MPREWLLAVVIGSYLLIRFRSNKGRQSNITTAIQIEKTALGRQSWCFFRI